MVLNDEKVVNFLFHGVKMKLKGIVSLLAIEARRGVTVILSSGEIDCGL